MKKTIQETAKMITDYIDSIIASNTDKSFINGAEFEFLDEDCNYKSPEFRKILDNHFKEKNVTYTFKEVKPREVYFKVKLHDWIKQENN